MSTITPAIDYTSKDFEGFRQSLLDYAARVMPEWQSRSEGDFGVVLVELLSYMGDVLSYYGDRLQAEAYLSTATQRLSLLHIADLLGYVPSNGVPATGTVTFQTNNPGGSVFLDKGTKVSTAYLADLDGPLIFETDSAVTVPKNGGTITVSVTQGSTTEPTLVGTSNGLPAQQFRLPSAPVIRGSVQVNVQTSSTTTEEWSEIDYLVDADAQDRVFSTFNDEDGYTWISFGDGLNGAIPNNQLEIHATYRVGGGQIGNIAEGQIGFIYSDAIQGVSIALDSEGNPMSSATTGGADAESIEQIRANAPRVFRTQNRAVTLQDFVDLCLSVPGVVRANAIAGTFTSVTVFIVGPDGRAANALLTDSVRDTLLAKALAGCDVTVSAPVFVDVNVGTPSSPIAVQVYGRYKRAAVLAAVEEAIKTMLSFANVDFGQRLTVSDFYAAIMAVEGVQYVNIPMIARSDSAQSGTADIVFREWEIPVMGSLNVIANGGIA